jgi:Integrase core domain
MFALPPRSPKLNGHVERSNRTHREEFYQVVKLPTSLAEVNRALRKWEDIHDSYKPHQALRYLTPKFPQSTRTELRLAGRCSGCTGRVQILARGLETCYGVAQLASAPGKSGRGSPTDTMTAIGLTSGKISARAGSLAGKFGVPVLIFAVAFLGYYLSTTEVLQREPADWYKHYVYLSEAILHGKLNVGSVGIPDFYQDVVTVGGSKYLPFAPAPSVLLLPFVAIWGTHTSEVYFSMVLGAINVVLFSYLLGVLSISRTTKLLLIPFFAFGTVHFYAATTGTVWFFGHVAAVFFLLLALIALFRKASPILTAILLGLAFMSREPTVLSAPVFLYVIFRQHHDTISREALLNKQTVYQLGSFCVGLLPFVIFWFWYNFARFGGPLDTGYDTVHNAYTNGGIPYAFYLQRFPNAPRFNLFDVRSIPLHLYTIFLMPPDFHPDWSVFQPSPYGMSVLLTSPAFVYSAAITRKHYLKPALWTAIGLVSVPLLLHYSQGWVQFGYRFLLDFAPFLLILTAFGFDDHQSPGSRRMQLFLVAVSIVAGFWGRYWANRLGW